MRLFYHYLPCLACHGDLNSRKATYVAEFIPDFRLLIGGDRYYRNNQFAVSFIDSVKHSGATHWGISANDVIFDKSLQQMKAPSPMLATLSGNVSSVKPLQP